MIEVCVGSVDDALAADPCGVGRIELSAALELDGVTPSMGATEAVLAGVRTPVVALVRCHPGGFEYAADEVETMARDARRFAALGVEGVAIGALRADGSLDTDAMRRIADAARCGAAGVRLVCHRGFDRATDLDGAIDALAAMGFDRVLTSGGTASALEGAPTIARLRARSPVEPVPAGGVRSANIAAVARATGCAWVHGSFRAGMDVACVRLDVQELEAALRAAGGV